MNYSNTKFNRSINLICLIIACFLLSACNHNDNTTQLYDAFFSSFPNYECKTANFRVGASSDSARYNVTIKAMTIAHFGDSIYKPLTIYVLKHTANDSIVIKTEDTPLISHNELKDFYSRNRQHKTLHQDTLVNPDVFDKFFFINHPDTVNVESIKHLPFLFLDVNFDGHPALLVRKDKGNNYYYYKTYGITESGFRQVDFEPYQSIKSRIGEYTYGGSTEFDYKNRTITVFNLSEGSCSCHGILIKDVYKLNPTTKKFEKRRFEQPYELD